jgi:hypothetical protein
MTPSDRGSPLPPVQRPQALHELAPGLALAGGGPGRTLNVYLLGTVVLDSGVRWSHRRLARQLAGRPSLPTRSPMPTTTMPAPRPGCAAPWACRCGAVPATPPRSAAAGSTATARRGATGSSAPWRLSPLTRSAASLGKATSWQGSRCWRSRGTLRVRWRSGGSGTGCWSAGMCWPTSACIPPGPAWCWRRRRCRQTTRRIGVRLLAGSPWRRRRASPTTPRVASRRSAHSAAAALEQWRPSSAKRHTRQAVSTVSSA